MEDEWMAEAFAATKSSSYQLVAAGGPVPSPAGAPGPSPGPAEPKPSDSFMKGCLHIVQAILYNSEGHHGDIGEYLTIVCAVPKSGADVSLCQDFREALLGHLHPADNKWNRNGMDFPLFCNGFHKTMMQHVYEYYPHERAPSGGPGAAPSAAASPAAVAAPPPAF